jgi:hypothetical protein
MGVAPVYQQHQALLVIEPTPSAPGGGGGHLPSWRSCRRVLAPSLTARRRDAVMVCSTSATSDAQQQCSAVQCSSSDSIACCGVCQSSWTSIRQHVLPTCMSYFSCNSVTDYTDQQRHTGCKHCCCCDWPGSAEAAERQPAQTIRTQRVCGSLSLAAWFSTCSGVC